MSFILFSQSQHAFVVLDRKTMSPCKARLSLIFLLRDFTQWHLVSFFFVVVVVVLVVIVVADAARAAFLFLLSAGREREGKYAQYPIFLFS